MILCQANNNPVVDNNTVFIGNQAIASPAIFERLQVVDLNLVEKGCGIWARDLDFAKR